MLVVRIKGGLGNQLFQYASAKGLARRCGHTLKIDSRTGFLGYPRDIYNRRYKLHAFAIPHATASKAEIWCARLLSWRHWLAFREAEGKAMLERGEFFQPRLLKQLRKPLVYLEGYLQSPRYFENVAEELHRELRLPALPDPTTKVYLRQIQAVAAVSVHVRRRDYARLLPTEYYRKAVELVKARVADPYFFLFTDDNEWTVEALSWLQPKIIVDNGSPDDDVRDLFLMASCRHHIIANSTFSWWGAWISACTGITVAPALGWTVNGCPPRDLFPGEWIVI